MKFCFIYLGLIQFFRCLILRKIFTIWEMKLCFIQIMVTAQRDWIPPRFRHKLSKLILQLLLVLYEATSLRFAHSVLRDNFFAVSSTLRSRGFQMTDTTRRIATLPGTPWILAPKRYRQNMSLEKICFALCIGRKLGEKEFLKSYIVLLRAKLNCIIYASRMGWSASAS